MRPLQRSITQLLVGLVLAAPSLAADGETERWTGRPLAEVLEALRGEGLRLLYGSNVVRPDMTVESEPRAATARAQLDEILEPHGLTAEEGAGGILRVVIGPEGALVGEIRNVVTGEGLSNAQVLVSGQGPVRTNDAGHYRVDALRPGLYQVEIRKAGFVIEQREIRVPAGRPARLDVDLEPVAQPLEAMIVTPGQVRLFTADPSPEVLWTRDEVQRLPHLSDDLFRAVSRLSGMASGDFSADFHVRGGERTEVLVVIDGLRVYEPYHLKDVQNVFSIFDTRATGSVQVMSGGFTAEYGDRMSGVIEIDSLVPVERRTLLGLSFEKVHFASFGTFPGAGGDWLVSARRGYLDLLLDRVESDDDDFDLRPSYYDLFAKLRRPLGSRNFLGASLLAAADDLTFANDDDDDALSSSYGNAYAWLRLDSLLPGTVTQTTVLAVGRLDRERQGVSGSNHSDPFPGFKSDEDVTRVFDRRETRIAQLRQDWTWDAASRQLWRWGLEVQRLEADYDYAFENRVTDPVFTNGEIVTRRSFDLAPSGWTYGLYVSERIRVAPRWTLEAGGRWDRQTYADDDELTPRLNLVGQLGPRTILRAAWGRYAQSQGIHELQIEDGIDRFHHAQVNEQATLALEHRYSSRNRWAIQLYDKRIDEPRARYENLFEPIDVFPEGQSDRVLVAPDRARARGVELLFEHRRPSFEAWAAYTLSKAEDRIDDQWVARSWNQRHALSYSLNWRLGDRWNVNLAGVHHSGWPATDVVLVTDPDGTPRLEPTPRNSSNYPDYHRLDLRASRSYALDRGGRLELFVEVTNLLGRDNIRSISDFEFHPGDRGTPVIDRELETWLPRLPSFGVTWIF